MDPQRPRPELSETRYCIDVLQLSVDKSELDLDRELVARANAIGIRTALPSLSKHRRTTSLALSDSTVSTFQEPISSSPASDGTASTHLTPHSSIFGPPSPDLAPAANTDSAVGQSATLSFSLYDKYLAQHVQGAASYPSKRKSVGPADGGLFFSTNTRRSLSGIKHRIKFRRMKTRIFESV